MDKKTREGGNISLLDNTHEETQVKDKANKVAGKVTIIVLLITLLIVSCFFNFSSNTSFNFLSLKLESDFNMDNYYKSSSCELIIIKQYNKFSDAKVGDIVCYSTILEQGSGIFVSYEGGVFELEKENGEFVRVSEHFISGYQVNRAPILGFPIAFLDSYIGAIILFVILVIYVAYITFSRINYENTQHGKDLYQLYKRKKKEEKRTKDLLEQVEDLDGVSLKIANILDGPYEENVIKYNEFDQELKTTMQDKYKFILARVHNAYLAKELNREEKRYVSSVFELMFNCEDFDTDIEYMLIDFALKEKLQGFDVDSFKTGALNFIKEEDNIDSLINLGSVLYAMVYRDPKLRNDKFKDIALNLKVKLSCFDKIEGKKDKNIADTILNLIKS